MDTNDLLQQILGKLDSLEAGQSRLEAGQSNLETRQSKMETSQLEMKTELKQEIAEVKQEIKQEIAEVKQDIREIHVILENDIPREIHIIAEQHTDMIQKLNALSADKITNDETRGRVSTLETVVEQHSTYIQELQKRAI